MTNEETIAYFKERNESLVSFAKNENVYDYDKQVIEAVYMRRCFEANEKAILALEQQPILDTRQRERQLEMEYQHGYDKGWEEGRKTLEQEPCEDCISRQAAVELIKNYCENGCDIVEDNWCPSCQREQFMELLKAMPSVIPKGVTVTDFADRCRECGRIKTSEDAISRQAIKEMLSEEWTKYMPMELDINLSFVMEKINDLPSVTSQQTRWIPVSERLPEDGQSVLFCDIENDIMLGYHIKGRPNTHFSQDGTFEDTKDVIAWMPLPEPYIEESEDVE